MVALVEVTSTARVASHIGRNAKRYAAGGGAVAASGAVAPKVASQAGKQSVGQSDPHYNTNYRAGKATFVDRDRKIRKSLGEAFQEALRGAKSLVTPERAAVGAAVGTGLAYVGSRAAKGFKSGKQEKRQQGLAHGYEDAFKQRREAFDASDFSYLNKDQPTRKRQEEDPFAEDALQERFGAIKKAGRAAARNAGSDVVSGAAKAVSENPQAIRNAGKAFGKGAAEGAGLERVRKTVRNTGYSVGGGAAAGGAAIGAGLAVGKRKDRKEAIPGGHRVVYKDPKHDTSEQRLVRNTARRVVGKSPIAEAGPFAEDTASGVKNAVGKAIEFRKQHKVKGVGGDAAVNAIGRINESELEEVGSYIRAGKAAAQAAKATRAGRVASKAVPWTSRGLIATDIAVLGGGAAKAAVPSKKPNEQKEGARVSRVASLAGKSVRRGDPLIFGTGTALGVRAKGRDIHDDQKLNQSHIKNQK